MALMETHDYDAVTRGASRISECKSVSGNVPKPALPVNAGLCQGCGTCVALCRSKSIDLQGFSNEQIFAELMAL